MAKTNTLLRQTAYDYILDLIMTRQLLPGDKVPEAAVAQKFQISRTPVRDAMQQLANEGLLEIFPNRFVRVKSYEEDDILEIGALRLAMDTLSIKLASLFGSRADFMRLDEIAAACEEASRSDDHQNLSLIHILRPCPRTFESRLPSAVPEAAASSLSSSGLPCSDGCGEND